VTRELGLLVSELVEYLVEALGHPTPVATGGCGLRLGGRGMVPIAIATTTVTTAAITVAATTVTAVASAAFTTAAAP
jgi:hypothetical protein